MPDPKDPRSPLVGSRSYWFHRWVVQLLVARFLRLQVEGLEHVPPTGGLLLVSNHVSLADPPLIATILSRPVTFMGKAELFKQSFLRLMFRSWGVFPVRRGEVDIGAVRMALSLLREGTAVVVFPEGTRHPEGLGEALPGIGFFAARSGCPVVPVGIVGTESIRSLLDIRHGYAVNVRFGEAFSVPKGENEEGAELIMQNIAALLPEERRGRYDATSRDAANSASSAPRGA